MERDVQNSGGTPEFWTVPFRTGIHMDSLEVELVKSAVTDQTFCWGEGRPRSSKAAFNHD